MAIGAYGGTFQEQVDAYKEQQQDRENIAENLDCCNEMLEKALERIQELQDEINMDLAY